MNDLTLNLPSGVRLNTLDVVASFPEYSELLQRVVVLVLMSDLSEMQIDGRTLPELLRTANRSNIAMLNSNLNFIASEALSLLNSEGEVAQSLSISANEVGGVTYINITVTAVDGETASGEYVVE